MTNKKETNNMNTTPNDETVAPVEHTPEEIKAIRDQLQVYVNEAYAALNKAEKFALAHKEGFSFEPTYGMGGYFDPDPHIDAWGEEQVGWCPSSQGC